MTYLLPWTDLAPHSAKELSEDGWEWEWEGQSATLLAGVVAGVEWITDNYLLMRRDRMADGGPLPTQVLLPPEKFVIPRLAQCVGLLDGAPDVVRGPHHLVAPHHLDIIDRAGWSLHPKGHHWRIHDEHDEPIGVLTPTRGGMAPGSDLSRLRLVVDELDDLPRWRRWAAARDIVAVLDGAS